MARGTIEKRQPNTARTVGGRAPGFGIEFDPRTAWDFIVSMGLGDAAENDLTTSDREWLASARESLDKEQRDLVGQLFDTHGLSPLDSLPVIAIERPDVRVGADVVRLLEETPAQILITATLRDALTEAVPEEVTV